MSYDKSNIQVLVVDHDDESLASLTNILMTWQYKGTLSNHHIIELLYFYWDFIDFESFQICNRFVENQKNPKQCILLVIDRSMCIY